MWLLLLVVFLSGCTVVIKDREAIPQRERERATGPLRAYCPSKVETVGFYCTGNRAYSNLVQAGSRVRVYSQSKELKKPQRGGGKGNRPGTPQGGQGAGPFGGCGEEVGDDGGWRGSRGGGCPLLWRLGAFYYVL